MIHFTRFNYLFNDYLLFLSKKQNVNGKQIKSNKISTVVAPAVVKDKDALDMDLDTYMAKSKNHLDADLDTYMAQTTSILI